VPRAAPPEATGSPPPRAYTSPRAVAGPEPDFATTPYAAPRPESPRTDRWRRPPFPLRLAGDVVLLVGALAVAAGLVALFFAVRAAFDDSPSRAGIVLRLGFPAVLALLAVLFGGGLVRGVGRRLRTRAEGIVASAVILSAVGVLAVDLAVRSHLSTPAVEYDEVVPGRSLTVVDTLAGPDTWDPQRYAAMALAGVVTLGLVGLLAGGLWRRRWNDTALAVLVVAAAVVAGLARSDAGQADAAARRARAASACAQIAHFAGDDAAARARRCADPFGAAARVGSR